MAESKQLSFSMSVSKKTENPSFGKQIFSEAPKNVSGNPVSGTQGNQPSKNGNNVAGQQFPVSGEILGRIFYNEDSGYGIYTVRTNEGEEISLKGVMPKPLCGERFSAIAVRETHPIYGDSLEVVERVVISPPNDLQGIKTFLADGFASGIGMSVSSDFVNHFKTDAIPVLTKLTEQFSDELDTLTSTPVSFECPPDIPYGSQEWEKMRDETELERVRKFFEDKLRDKKEKKKFDIICGVPGVGPKRASWLLAGWVQNKAVHELHIYLYDMGLSPALVHKIIKFYGQNAVEKINANPYDMIGKIDRLKFSDVDRIGKKLGIPADDPRRIGAVLVFQLTQASFMGHMCLPIDLLINESAKFTGIDRKAGCFKPCLEKLIEENRIVMEDDKKTGALYVYLRNLAEAEMSIAMEIRNRVNAPKNVLNGKILDAVLRQSEMRGVTLDDSQKEALAGIVESNVAVLTGGPGTGKTTLVTTLLDYYDLSNVSYTLCSPTGNAAKRLQEVTGRATSTIHSAIRLNPETGVFTENVFSDVVVVDEASMLDAVTTSAILRASENSRVLFVGDIDQLPSIGAGNVFSNLFSMKGVAVSVLNKIHRQADGGIVRNAASLRGLMHARAGSLSPADVRPENIFQSSLATGRGKGEFFMTLWPSKNRFADDDRIETEIAGLIQDSGLRSRFAPEDIQVLAPIRKGLGGMYSLNVMLQKILNSRGKSGFTSYLTEGKWEWREGDRVLCIKNDSDRGLCNGEQGTVVGASPERKELEILFPRTSKIPMVFSSLQLDILYPCYAMTVHKSQGNEYPCVIFAVSSRSAATPILTRRLLYTGITRAKRECYLIANQAALSSALLHGVERRRYGRLPEIFEELSSTKSAPQYSMGR